MSDLTFYFRDLKVSTDFPCRETLLMRLIEAESLLKESSRILSYESPRSEFGQLMTAAEESMGQLATYIASIRNM